MLITCHLAVVDMARTLPPTELQVMRTLVPLSQLQWPLPICGMMERSIASFPLTTVKPTQTPTPLRNGATSLKLSGMDPQALAVLQCSAPMARSSKAFKLGSLSATIILLATWAVSTVPIFSNPPVQIPSQLELTCSFRIRGVHLFSTHERRCG